MKTSEVLDKAADVIGRNGWHQGGFIGEAPSLPVAERPCCVMAALAIAECGDPFNGFGLADEVLMDFLGLGEVEDEGADYPLGDWNDESGRTEDEVIAALRAAAEDESREGR